MRGLPGQDNIESFDREESLYRYEIKNAFASSYGDKELDYGPLTIPNRIYGSVKWIRELLRHSDFEQTQYLLGLSGKGLGLDDEIALNSALTLVVEEFMAYSKSESFLDVPLVANKAELNRLAKDLVARRKALQRAARDYWKSSGPNPSAAR